jgi:hypothetical protein
VTRPKFSFTVNRFTIFAGTAALMAMLPCVTLSAPTGGAVFRAAPVVARPEFPQRPAEQNRGNVTVPFHVDAAPKATQTLRVPTSQWHPAWTWRPNYVWFANPCFANGANWAPLQSAGTSQSALNDISIGSLAGDPKHSILSSSASDIASHLASSSTAAADSSATPGLQIQWQPLTCGQQW